MISRYDLDVPNRLIYRQFENNLVFQWNPMESEGFIGIHDQLVGPLELFVVVIRYLCTFGQQDWQQMVEHPQHGHHFSRIPNRRHLHFRKLYVSSNVVSRNELVTKGDGSVCLQHFIRPL